MLFPSRHSCHLALLLCVASLLSTSCATVFKPIFGAGKIDVSSKPQGASVSIDNKVLCTTPCQIEPSDDQKQYMVELKLAEYSPINTEIKRGFYWPFWVNTAAGIFAIIPMGIDWLTGAMWRFKPTKIFADFEAQGKGSGEVETDVVEPEEKKEEPPKAVPEPVAPAQIIVVPNAPKEPEPPPVEVPQSPKLSDEDDIKPEVRKAVVDAYSDEDLNDTIRQYYGAISDKELQKTRKRIRRILAAQVKAGEAMNLDAALTLDYSQNLNK